MQINQALLERNPALGKFSESIVEILESNRLCSMATVNPDGSPHINTAYFAADDELHLYVLTQPTTRHGRNLKENQNIAMTIFDSRQPWGEPHRGLQVIGICHQEYGLDQDYAFIVYSARHSGLLSLATTSADLTAQLESRLYNVTATQIKIVDEPRYGEETHFDVQIHRSLSGSKAYRK